MGTKRTLTLVPFIRTLIDGRSVYHLAALRRTLSELDLSLNATIDDDVAPALLALRKLAFLSLFDTGVRMPGLRRLAGSGRLLNIEAPRQCEEYLESASPSFLIYSSIRGDQ